MRSFLDALEKAGTRPGEGGEREDKKNYAELFSRALAQLIANGLRKEFPGIMPDKDGRRHESPAMGGRGAKKLDVNFSTPTLGMGLGVTVKTLNFRDPKSRRYTKNYTRIDNELRAEAKDYHVRQPYAVLVGALYLPVDACDDGKVADSSFAGAVAMFRQRSGRVKPANEQELLERFFVALYESEGPERGEVAYFDVANEPPGRGRVPQERLMSHEQFLEQVKIAFRLRNP